MIVNGGQVAYRLEGDDAERATWLCYVAAQGGQWFIQDEGQKGSAQGVYCTAAGAGHPWDEGVRWLEMDAAGPSQSEAEVRDRQCARAMHTPISGFAS